MHAKWEIDKMKWFKVLNRRHLFCSLREVIYMNFDEQNKKYVNSIFMKLSLFHCHCFITIDYNL